MPSDMPRMIAPALHASKPFRKSSTVAPSSRFSHKARTGTLVRGKSRRH
jgi:hypothetical protein